MSLSFEELSRKAAAGALSADERTALDAMLRDDPKRRAELEWDDAFARKLDERVDAYPPMPGWERTVRALRLHAAPPAPRGILDRLGEWMSTRLGFGMPLQAIAAALILAQAAVIGWLVVQERPDYSEVRSGAPSKKERDPLLRVSFRQDAREADLRKAIADIGGDIVGGPGQIGIYIVRVRSGDPAAAAERLRASGVTELVEVFTPER